MKVNQIREEEVEEGEVTSDEDDLQTPGPEAIIEEIDSDDPGFLQTPGPEAIIAEIDPDDPGFLQEGKDFWARFWSFVPVSPSKSRL